MDFKISRKNPQTKSLKTFDKCLFVISKGYGLKNLQKIYSLANGFLFFVIFISGKGFIGIIGSSVFPSPSLSQNNQPNVGRGNR
jgi:hypothetical protein